MALTFDHVLDLLQINGQLYGDKVDELSMEQHIDSWLEVTDLN